jgi:glycosyltransferase 2 family protein
MIGQRPRAFKRCPGPAAFFLERYLAKERQGKRLLRRAALPVIGVALSAAGLAYVYRDFDLRSFLSSAADIRVLPLLGTLAVYWLGTIVFRAVLVRHLLKPVGSVPLAGAYRYICIGFLANNVLPFRAGEVARSAAIHRGTGLRFSSIVGGLALERMLDMGMVAFIAFLALRSAPLPEAVRTAALLSATLVVAGLVVVILLARRTWREVGAGETSRAWAFLWNTWVRFSAGLGSMARPAAIAVGVGLIVGVWACALAAMAFRLEAFGIPASPSLALTLLTCLGFGVAIPSAPGYVGVYHAAAAFALELHGVPHATAGAFALFSWLVDIGVGSAMGAVSLSIEGIRLRDLRQRRSLAPDRLP